VGGFWPPGLMHRRHGGKIEIASSGPSWAAQKNAVRCEGNGHNGCRNLRRPRGESAEQLYRPQHLTRPLAGITVVQVVSEGCGIALRLSVALAGRIAADLGADVVLVEPPGGDPLRAVPPLAGETSALFAFLSAGKRSVVLPPGADALERLLGGAAALVTDGGLTRRAALTAALGARLPPGTPRAAAVLTMLGADVPADAPASEFTVMALGGMLDIVGEPDRQPLRLGGHQAAYATGLAAYTGLAAALCGAPSTGPEIVHVSMLETTVWLNWKSVTNAWATGHAPSRSGRGAEWQVIRCADGWVALVYQDGDWSALCKLTGDPRLAAPEYATRDLRVPHFGTIAGIVEQSFARMTRREIHANAQAQRLPLGPVWSQEDLLEDPHNVARGFMANVTLPGGGSVTMPRLPVLWNGESFAPGPVPAQGAPV
jgi:crotonobetainyl-CoA:carnitine CoA-transferase CaiB-like acyl-CoA transferase